MKDTVHMKMGFSKNRKRQFIAQIKYSLFQQKFIKESGFSSLSHWEEYHRRETEVIPKSSVISPKDTEN